MAEQAEPAAPRGGKYVAKVPKGTRDINPDQSAVREIVMNKVTEVFKRHGGVTIETPVFELKETLIGKYGEDSKLIYDLQDQGGEICSLRYDLTVPFARYIAMNKVSSMRRYQIAKVYRRDQPAMGKGKYREFYQCDFDIAGATDTMIAEAECVKMMTEMLDTLEVGAYCIKVNHRKLLDGIFAVCGVPEDKFRPICSAVDKLDKLSWEEVRKEMVETKGLAPEVADKIWEFVSFKGSPREVLEKLRGDGKFKDVDYALGAVEEMGLLFEYLDSYQVAPPKVSFDLSLARGLDYYTGIIYEAVLLSGAGAQLGSIAGGGRYDNLVGIFSNRQVPCVGFSVGIERLFNLLEENAKASKVIRRSPTDVMVVAIGKGLLKARLEVVNMLWAAGIRTEQLLKVDPKPKNQLDYASSNSIPFAVIFGEDEIAKGSVGVKDLRTSNQETVPRDELVAYLQARLGAPAGAAPSASAAPAAAAPAAGGAGAGAVVAKGKDSKAVAVSGPSASSAEYIPHRIKIFEEIHNAQMKEYEVKAEAGTPIEVTLPDGSTRAGIAFKTTPLNIAHDISKSLAGRTCIAKVDGALWDTFRPLEASCKLELLDFNTEDGKKVFWHSTAHMMGQALEGQYGCLLCIGPCNGTDQGFFYDSHMGDKVITETDYKTVETAVQKVANAKQPYQRAVITREQALEIFKHNPFKCELIRKFAEEGTTMTCYRCGDLVDLCRGPHVPNTGMVKAMKVTNHGQAYWLGNSDNASLQRVYGVSFPDKKELQQYVHFLEEAKKRDHRKLGEKQELFFFDPLSPGSCFFLPQGTYIYNALVELMRSEYKKRGFTEVVTPNVYNMKLWETSGHAQNYKENMFLFNVEGQEFGLKPMNCPGHCLLFKHRVRSYRELPLRVADFGVLHRNEFSGALTGLTRVRRFQQDDAHIFCMPDQVKDEIRGALDFLRHVYGIFGFEFTLLLSTRPEKYLGEIEVWNGAEAALSSALDESGMKWEINEGDGAFYGPKIDIQVSDALRRKHQCATIQLDFQLPIRFGLEYMTDAAGDDKTARPVMVHRAILGSVERMISILTEHYGGKWPLWLSPRKVAVIPVKLPEFEEYCNKVQAACQAVDILCQIDLTNASLNKKIRNAQIAQFNYIIVVGDKEVSDGSVAVRRRQVNDSDTNVDLGSYPLDAFVSAVAALHQSRSMDVLGKYGSAAVASSQPADGGAAAAPASAAAAPKADEGKAAPAGAKPVAVSAPAGDAMAGVDYAKLQAYTSANFPRPAKAAPKAVAPAAAAAKPPADDDDDDDIDFFAEDEEEDEETKHEREMEKKAQAGLRAAAAKNKDKPKPVAKTSILLDVKPWDDETDMVALEAAVRTLEMDGLVWGASKLVPVGYGIKKLQILCVVEDDKVCVDDIEEHVMAQEDYCQSMDVAAMSKI